MLVAHKKDGARQPKYWKNSNKIFLSVITVLIEHFDVSRTQMNGGSSYNIMYSKLFENMGRDKGNLWLYEGSYMHVFNDTLVHYWVYIDLMIFVEDGREYIGASP